MELQTEWDGDEDDDGPDAVPEAHQELLALLVGGDGEERVEKHKEKTKACQRVPGVVVSVGHVVTVADCGCGAIYYSKMRNAYPYLIFVISFTQTGFSKIKFYTQKND